MSVLAILLCAIRLSGVTGTELRARAFFDANNVKVGDPMVLTIDFLGTAEFRDLHPPALSKIVNRRDWKVDDASAKTETFEDARRLVYRVRPMREGVLWFPALEFECEAANGAGELRFRANDIPVHAKAGAQVAMGDIGGECEEAGEESAKDAFGAALLKEPEDLGVSVTLDEDARFAWRRALVRPTAAAFATMGFAAARYNEAICEIREGNWAKAMGIFRRLEWQVGQTPAIERGIEAALRVKYDNPEAELPMWRQVLRPWLRFAWAGRVGMAVGGFLAVAFVFWLLGRGIRAVAAVAMALAIVLPVDAQDIFRQMEERMNRMQLQMQQSFGGFGMGGGFSMGGVSEEARKVTATLSIDKPEIQVGESFNFIVTLEYPRTASVGQIQLTPSERFGVTFTGQAQNLTDGKAANTSNVVKRLAIPARYDVPWRGKMAFSIEGMISGRETRNGGRFSFTFSNSFGCSTQALEVEVKPLDASGQPEGFAGIVAEDLRFGEGCDIVEVETNDVVSITYAMAVKGYLPKDFMPKGAAFEISRKEGRDGMTRAEYRRYFVADGKTETPKTEIAYYDIRTKKYRVVRAGGMRLKYKTTNEFTGGEHGKND